ILPAPVTVDGGTLNINGTLPSTAATVNSTATLGVSGTMNAITTATINTGGTLNVSGTLGNGGGINTLAVDGAANFTNATQSVTNLSGGGTIDLTPTAMSINAGVF